MSDGKAGSSETPYVLEHNVAVPPRCQGRRQSYPWEELQPGDSILIPCAPHERGMMQARVTSAKNLFLKRSGSKSKFITRRVPEGVRLWRTT